MLNLCYFGGCGSYTLIYTYSQRQQSWNVPSYSWIGTWQQHSELLYCCCKRRCDIMVVICVQSHVLIWSLERRCAIERCIYLEHCYAPPMKSIPACSLKFPHHDILVSSLIFISIIIVNRGIINESSWTFTSVPKQFLLE